MTPSKRPAPVALVIGAGDSTGGAIARRLAAGGLVACVTRREVGPIEVLVFNIGAKVPCSILEETARKYFKVWEMACFGAFARAKHALRALAQSMARELGPLNIHVAHVVVDGAIDIESIRSNFPDK